MLMQGGGIDVNKGINTLKMHHVMWLKLRCKAVKEQQEIIESQGGNVREGMQGCNTTSTKTPRFNQNRGNTQI